MRSMLAVISLVALVLVIVGDASRSTFGTPANHAPPMAQRRAQARLVHSGSSTAHGYPDAAYSLAVSYRPSTPCLALALPERGAWGWSGLTMLAVGCLGGAIA